MGAAHLDDSLMSFVQGNVIGNEFNGIVEENNPVSAFGRRLGFGQDVIQG